MMVESKVALKSPENVRKASVMVTKEDTDEAGKQMDDTIVKESEDEIWEKVEHSWKSEDEERSNLMLSQKSNLVDRGKTLSDEVSWNICLWIMFCSSSRLKFFMVLNLFKGQFVLFLAFF